MGEGIDIEIEEQERQVRLDERLEKRLLVLLEALIGAVEVTIPNSLMGCVADDWVLHLGWCNQTYSSHFYHPSGH